MIPRYEKPGLNSGSKNWTMIWHQPRGIICTTDPNQVPTCTSILQPNKRFFEKVKSQHELVYAHTTKRKEVKNHDYIKADSQMHAFFSHDKHRKKYY